MKDLSLTRKIHLILGAHIILWLNAGNYSYIGGYVPAIVKFGIVGLWFGIALMQDKGFLPRYLVVGWGLAILLAFTFFSKLIGNDKYFEQFGMNWIYGLVLIGVFSFYFYTGTKGELRFLLTIFMLDILIVSAVTYIALLETPELARILSTGAAHKQASGLKIPKGVGGYGLCYELVLIQPVITRWFQKNKVNVLIQAGYHGVMMLLLFQAQITLAFVMYPVLLIVDMFFGGKKTINAFVGQVALIIMAALLLIWLPSILRWLIDIADEHLAVRLQELLDVVENQEITGDDMLARMRLYQRSWDMFIESPFWGSFGDRGYGSHSSFLDILAAYGLLGLTGYFGILGPMGEVRQIVKQNYRLKKSYILLYLAVIALSVLNPITGAELLLVILVIIPVAFKYLSMEQIVKDEIGAN